VTTAERPAAQHVTLVYRCKMIQKVVIDLPRWIPSLLSQTLLEKVSIYTQILRQ
jgi:hypothetical protein